MLDIIRVNFKIFYHIYCEFIFVEVWYNIALCYYELKQYAQAVQHLGAIVEKGIKEYPGRIK